MTELSASTPSLAIYDPALLGGRGLPFVRLVWQLDVTDRAGDMRELVLIDAARGSVALHFDQIAHAKKRITCDGRNRVAATESNFPCTNARAERTETSGAAGIVEVDDAQKFAGHTYDFFFDRFGRDSLDGQGMTLKSTVRYCDQAGPCPYGNAFWNGGQMVYGAGFANADDIVAHELTHGVTEYASDLYYYYQSGAINEALSDIFGEFVDLTNGAGTDTAATRWLIGEDAPDGPFRDMADPTTLGQPDRMQSPIYWGDPDDHGGVHSNSGVANKAAYLMADGGTFNGRTMTPIGIDRAAAVWYRVAVNYLGNASDYADLGAALDQACADLIGSSVRNTAGTVTGTIAASHCTQVRKAVTATEMSLQPTSPHATAPDAPLCDSGSPSDVLYDPISEGAPGWKTSGTPGWHYGDWYATSPDFHLYGYMDTSATPSTIARASSTAIPANAFLHFAHAHEFEWYSGSTYYDGGVLEYRVDGSTWTDSSLLPAVNGYNGLFASGHGNPLQGRSAFVGLSHGYMSSRYDLSSLSGQSVKFRFRLSSDDNDFAFEGWYVDDFRIYTCATAATRQPDARIRVGTGAFVGDDVYNTTSKDQKRTASAAQGSAITFGISVQNDGTAADSFRVQGGGSIPAYNVKYKIGGTDVTAAVTAGTYQTPSLAPGATQLITVTVRVKGTAPTGSKVAHKVTITSVGDGTKQDAVKFVAKRS